MYLQVKATKTAFKFHCFLHIQPIIRIVIYKVKNIVAYCSSESHHFESINLSALWTAFFLRPVNFLPIYYNDTAILWLLPE